MTVRLVPSESDSSPTPPVAAPTAPREPPAPPPGSTPPSTDAGTTAPVARVAAAPAGTDGVAGTVAAAPAGTEPAPAGAVEPDTAPGVPDPVTTESRVALREARRARRRTAWLCAAVVALALALTIVVVSLARIRPIPQSSAAVTP